MLLGTTWQVLCRLVAGSRMGRRGWASSGSGRSPSLATSLRTHTCQSVHQVDVGCKLPACYEPRARLVGWLSHVRRLNAKLVFAGLRDGYGHVEVVASAETQGLELLEQLHRESIVSVEGIVRERVRTDGVDAAEINELHATRITVLSRAALLPVGAGTSNR